MILIRIRESKKDIISKSQYRRSIFDDSVFSSYISSSNSVKSSYENENLMELIGNMKDN